MPQKEVCAWEGDLLETDRDTVDMSMPDNVKRPIDYFLYYLDNDILEHVVGQSHLFSIQKHGKSLNLTVEELKAFRGIRLYMGVCTFPNLKDYWNMEMRVNQVGECMSLKRFQKIRSHLHLADNLDEREEVVGDNSWRKVRPLISHMQNRYRALEQEPQKSIDEVIVKYKGRFSSMKPYNPMKPIKWGFKVFALAGVSGIIYDFFLNSGITTFDECGLTEIETAMGVGAKAVISLCKHVKGPQATVVFFGFPAYHCWTILVQK